MYKRDYAFMMNVMEEIRSYRPIEISTNDIIIDTTSVADTRHGTSVRQLLLSSVQIELVYVSGWNTGSSYVGVDMGSIHPAHQEPVSGCTAAEARRNDVQEKGDDEDDNDWFFSHRNISEFIIYRFCLVGHLNSACSGVGIRTRLLHAIMSAFELSRRSNVHAVQ